MIGRIPPKRRDGKSSFVALVAYAVIRDEDKPDMPLEPEHPDWRRPRSKDAIFNRLVEYVSREGGEGVMETLSVDEYGRQRVLFDGVLCETNNFSLATSAVEMNAVALQNSRCKDPVLHYIISWPAEDKPTQDEVFESVRYTLNALGFGEHQYVAAIHTDTNNIHCHIAANRVHPKTYKAATNSFNYLVLQQALRELELRYDWTPTNGKRNEPAAPQGAIAMEYYADQQSLYSYVRHECFSDMNDLIIKDDLTWFDLHKLLVKQGLILERKGRGLVISSLDDQDVTPIKASSLHPDLTLNCLEDDLGPFVKMEDAGRYSPDEDDDADDALVHVYRYEPCLHKRDEGARAERRIARAEARIDLFDRYKKYSVSYTRPKMEGTDAMMQFKALSNRYAWKKAQVRYLFNEPLIRKMVYRTLEAERQKEYESLKAQIKQERDAFYQDPANRKLTKREWVEQQALKQDQAAISCLRGWSYRYKRNVLTPTLSENAIVCSVADDISPYEIEGYDMTINRDGTVQYKKDGIVQIQDTGSRIEIADPYSDSGQQIADAMNLAEEKSGERVEFRGETAFVNTACNMVPWFNEVGEKPLRLTNPEQQTIAGYNKPEKPAKEFVMTHRIVDEETYLASLQRSEQRNEANRSERNKSKSKRNTYRPH